MPSNREISKLFTLYAELLLLHNEDERLAALLSGAAYRLRNITERVASLTKEALSDHFKPEIIKIILELKNTGTIEAVDELIQLTPQGLFEMMRIKGLGGKKLSVLWKSAKIDSVDALLEACKKNKVSKIPGFGLKTQQNIINAIEADRSSSDHFHYASVADGAKALVRTLQSILKTKLISLCGRIRRQSLTVECIEIIAAIPAKNFIDKALRKFIIIQSSSQKQTKAHALDEIPVTIYHTSKDNFYYELFLRTGNIKHVKKLLRKINTKESYTSEEVIYKKAGLPYIVPEMREDVAEWNFKKDARHLITAEDIKGVVHNHTTWSDGVDTLYDFVMACKKRKYEYVVISDHSKNAHYAGGLKEEKAMKQMEEIDRLNKKFVPFKIFKSIECDILVSGELDYTNDFLQRFDLVIISVHQLLKMNEEKATKRLIKAIENPYTTILGHITGRQLLIRPGYPVNIKKVVDACAANNVIIEVNANPYRLDMDWSHIPYALSKGVMISVDPDAHSISEIDNIRWGVAAGRKGGLTKDMTWNAMPLKKIEQWLSDARR
jgi:DNA polymerase (family 10)